MRMARLHTGRHKVLADVPQLPRLDVAARSRRPAIRAGWRSEPAVPGVVHFCGPYLYRSSFHATTEAEECERALAHLDDVDHVRGCAHHRRGHPRTGGRHQRHPRAAAGLPAGRARALRPPRHHAHRRRGDGRLRSLRRVVRDRALGRDARPHLLRQGRQLRVRAAGWRHHLRRDRATFAHRVVPGRPHLLGPSARLRVCGASHRDLPGRGRPRTGPALGDDVSARRCRRSPGRHPSSARCADSACSGRSSSCATGRPASRSCRTTRAAPTPSRCRSCSPPARSGASGPSSTSTGCTSCRRSTISDDDMRAGLAIIDEALEVADEAVTVA